jgi:predicted enzyme related to lactoylglutathione lyase
MQPMTAPKVRRVLFNILCKDMATSIAFYKQLANFAEEYSSDWYVVLTAPDVPGLELGLIDQVSEFTPRHAWGMHEGTFLTLVVDDVFAAVERARALEVEVIEEPVALDYGQTRALIRDPNGLIIDLSTPTIELAERGDIDVQPMRRTVAIDQQQPEDKGRPSPI